MKKQHNPPKKSGVKPKMTPDEAKFRSYGERGPGKWITIYARNGHTFAVIAGLRLDTTPYDHYTGKWAPRWQSIYRPPHGVRRKTSHRLVMFSQEPHHGSRP